MLDLTPEELKNLQGKILGIAVDDSEFISTGSFSNRTVLSAGIDRVITRAINDIATNASASVSSVNAFTDRFNNIIGIDFGRDRDDFFSLEGALIPVVALLKRTLEGVVNDLDAKAEMGPYIIQGVYDTLEELLEAHPTGVQDEAHMVGPDLYSWSEKEQDWVLVGRIQGPMGPPGADGIIGHDGETGPTGPTGPPGRDAEDVVIKVSYENLGHLFADKPEGGQPGDAYLVGADLYVWKDADGDSPAGWVNKGNIKGPQGDIGPTGEMGPRGFDGTSVSIMGIFDDFASLLASHPDGNLGEAYLIGQELYVWVVGDDAGWYSAGQIKGPQGDMGPTGPQGDTGPRGYQGATGSQGPTGPQGHQGEQGEAGTSVHVLGRYDTEEELFLEHPAADPNDSYLVGDHLYVWLENLSAWSDLGPVQGPRGQRGPRGDQGEHGLPGPAGPQGEPGADGLDGTSILIKGTYDHYDDLCEAQPIGEVGDGYMIGNTLYIWSATEQDWEPVGDIKGPKGDKGARGFQGDPGPKGDPGTSIVILGTYDTFEELEHHEAGGEPGDGFLVGPDLYVWSVTKHDWVLAGPVLGPKGDQGPQGDEGPQGDRGEIGPQGPIGPHGPTGAKGDTGPQGGKGDPGEAGLKGDPGVSVHVLGSYDSYDELIGENPTGGINDAYLVEGDLFVWSETESDWISAGPIQGPEGPAGPTGPQGEQGEMGPTGAAGPQGEAGTSANILGSYDTFEELAAQQPWGNLNDSYLVGTVLYVWSPSDSAWVLAGEIKGPKGETGAIGPEGPQGDTGPAGPQGLTGETGETGPQGSKGDQGIKGDAGTSVFIRGSYDSYEDLLVGHPIGIANDAYLIQGILYYWSSTDYDWLPAGPIQGPQGDKGSRGRPGPRGPEGPAGTSVTILGSYETLDELQAAQPMGELNDSYLVGGILYVWNPLLLQWVEAGPITGPQGETGPAGPIGLEGPIGETGPAGPTGPAGTSVNVLGSYDSPEELEAAQPLGSENEAYLVGPILYVWSETAGEWVPAGEIKGPQGEMGPPGPQGLQGPAGEAGPTGPQGQPGTGVTILGSYETPEQLAAAQPLGFENEAYLVGTLLYVWSETEGQWLPAGEIKGPQGEAGAIGPTGPPGPTGAQGPEGATGPKGVAGDLGPQGPAGLQGPKGDPGQKGEAGTSVTIYGSYDSYEDLLEENPAGQANEAYLIGDILYVWSLTESDWVAAGPIKGPKGDKGARGRTGQPGPQGPAGPAGTSVNILGSYLDETSLKSDQPTGGINDSYLVGDILYVWSETEQDWVPAGSIKGPKGDPGEKGDAGTSVFILGSFDSLEELQQEAPIGDVNDAYLIGSVLYVWSPTLSDWVPAGRIMGPQGEAGPVGPPGPAGPAGTGVAVRGSYPTLSALRSAHPAGSINEAYLVDTILYVWSETIGDWVQAGEIKGPQGDKGDPGTQGPAGPTGAKGADGRDGAGVSLKDSYEDEASLRLDHPTGEAGDAYLVGSDLYVWSEVESDWHNVGQIKGPKGDQGETGAPGLKGDTGPAGPAGEAGESAFEIATAFGFTGTKAQFGAMLAALGDFAETLNDHEERITALETAGYIKPPLKS